MYLHFTPFTVEKSCGEVTRQNCSYFVNPGFPAPTMKMLACILTVEKVHPDVSQIRLDFFTFEVSFDKMIMMDTEDSSMNKKHYIGINLELKEFIKELMRSKNYSRSSCNFIETRKYINVETSTATVIYVYEGRKSPQSYIIVFLINHFTLFLCANH